MPAIKEAGDSALLLELEPVIDVDVNARAIGIAAAVRDDVIPGVRDVVPTFRSVAVYFDPLITDARDVVASLERAADAPLVPDEGRRVELAVEYGGQWGPDLADVAAFAGESPEAVVARHTARDYRVFMRTSGKSIRRLLRRGGHRRASGSGQARSGSRAARPRCIQWTHPAAGRSSATR
jgi:allophanate hydrolase subunit 1